MINRTESYNKDKVSWPTAAQQPVDLAENLPESLRRYVNGSDDSWLRKEDDLRELRSREGMANVHGDRD